MGKPLHLIGSNNSGKTTVLEAMALALGGGAFHQFEPSDWTVVTATHGPEFVCFSRPQVIVKLWREGDDVTRGILDSSVAADAVGFQEKLDERGNHEMLFGQRVVLCEGKDDCWAIRSGLSKLDATPDLDACGVTLVDTGSVGNLPDYADIAKNMGIPWCIISDEDRAPGGATNPITERIRKSVDTLRGPRDMSVIWLGKLETCLDVPVGHKTTPEWQAANTR